ncbi:hypothetical protein [Mycoplasma phage sp.]|uniref:Transmembrane protein n=2 Tax=Mycoplasmopsis anatis TaxID=171279 RepID=F9QDI2_9BACT|nr:hypothetical protein [Mycoplasmopsis anatis]QRI43889.1 hypothetical protein [Mycoplasma phage sp.]AWX70377.1 hypothetical protein DP067_03405 [Mycoplasmopsis anatis]EGS29198.1 hypothetical protein GIG_02448 [Mycoplasmopsis anatis 1340]QRI43942.1 hypothetical protein [Mycoplasma phage sp.]QRI43977.1 hypothetical protein [Mycoplasma phage sp.]
MVLEKITKLAESSNNIIGTVANGFKQSVLDSIPGIRIGIAIFLVAALAIATFNVVQNHKKATSEKSTEEEMRLATKKRNLAIIFAAVILVGGLALISFIPDILNSFLG